MNDTMMSRNNFVDDRRIPNWLKDNCVRLNDEGLNLRNLNMNIRRLNLASIVALSEALIDNKRIETLNLTSSLSNTQDDRNGIRVLLPLAYALRRHVSLKTIHLSYNQLVDATPLGRSLEQNLSSLAELYLDHNRLNTDTAVALSRALQHNNKLSVLQLDSNNIGDEGGALIAEALGINKRLKFLGLAQNSLKSKTASALLRTLDSNRNVSLEHLSLSDNPHLPISAENTILYLVRANRAGRYLLRDDLPKSIRTGDGDRNYNDDTHSTNRWLSQDEGNMNNYRNDYDGDVGRNGSHYKRKLWPRVFHGLEPDMIYFFLREKPSLVQSKYDFTGINATS
mmetsp:Transcript_5108/g.14844  ORF Transcript_5108/g.14844 Transcript_5108/m.14844 type:complete len:339 (-) Transcript_5108:977-1993(-)